MVLICRHVVVDQSEILQEIIITPQSLGDISTGLVTTTLEIDLSDWIGVDAYWGSVFRLRRLLNPFPLLIDHHLPEVELVCVMFRQVRQLRFRSTFYQAMVSLLRCCQASLEQLVRGIIRGLLVLYVRDLAHIHEEVIS